MDKDIGKIMGILLPIVVVVVFMIAAIFGNKSDPAKKNSDQLMKEHTENTRRYGG